jgi:hypothetical protein
MCGAAARSLAAGEELHGKKQRLRGSQQKVIMGVSARLAM